MWNDPPRGRKKTRNRRKRSSKGDVLMVRTQARKKSKPGARDERLVAMAVGLTVLLLGVGLVVAFGALRRSMFERHPRFTLQTIQADSDGVLKRSHLLAYAEVEEGTNLFSFELEALRNRLELQPIIKDATVRRTLPDRLDIQVTERKPLARLGHAGVKYHLIVDEEGVLIRKDYRATHLPMIYGIDHTRFQLGDSIADTPARDALTAIEACNDRLLSGILRLQAVVVGNDEYLTLRLKSGEPILIPRHNISNSLRTAAATLQAARAAGEPIGEIDLRHGVDSQGNPRALVSPPVSAAVRP